MTRLWNQAKDTLNAFCFTFTVVDTIVSQLSQLAFGTKLFHWQVGKVWLVVWKWMGSNCYWTKKQIKPFCIHASKLFFVTTPGLSHFKDFFFFNYWTCLSLISGHWIHQHFPRINKSKYLQAVFLSRRGQCWLVFMLNKTLW